MNFIRHFIALMDRIAMDERLTPHHVSLYFTLFQSWNLNHFENPVSIARQEIMKISKIGSVNTYTRCLKQLDQWEYLRYEPSYNPQRGSKVYLYSFDKADDKGNNKAEGQLTIMPVRPSINYINLLNKNKHSLYTPPPLSDSIKAIDITPDQSDKQEKNKKEKCSGQKERKEFQYPAEQEVITFFQSQRFPTLEAKKFFNYYQSTGWKVGKTKPMHDWQAAARNWMLNTKNYTHETHQRNHTPNPPAKRESHLHINQDKDYGEPL